MGDRDELLEENLRHVVANEVSDQQASAKADGRALDAMDQRQVARAVLQRELDEHAREAMRLGELPLPAADRDELIERVLRQVFSPLPSLDQYIHRPDVTNVHVQGCREVILELVDGSTERNPSPYTTQQQLIEELQHIASRGGPVAKEFNYANPLLHLALADGSRLTANAWVGPEPYVTIRRHPLIDHDLEDLAGLGMFDRPMCSLLTALVRSRKNVVIAGGTSDGKTTLLRAMTHKADPDERLIVLESEPELGLDRLPERHNHVVTISERPGNMAGDGTVDLAMLGWHAKRMSPHRVIFGEVLADEIVAMLEALSQGVPGSMATIHAKTSAAVFPRLPVYARSGGRDWRTGDIYALAALALDVVIFVARDRDGRRVVSEVLHIDHYDPTSEQLITNPWFLPDPDTGRATPASVIPVDLLDELVAHGYDPDDGHRPPNGARP